MKLHFLKKKYEFTRGVTFIELIVVISIFAMISTVTLFNFSDFSTNISLQNISHDIALKIAEVQRKAVSGSFDELQLGLPVDYAPTYGVYIATTSSTSSDFNKPGKEFISFIDLPTTNGVYDPGQTSGPLQTDCSPITTECLDRTFITTGDSISSIMLDGAPSSDVVILFKRPFPDARIYTSATGDAAQYNNADIEITSAKGAKKHVIINSIGQVRVE
jgi:prepilin-type N-terminal cleavage/methylation domain-containing protein